MVRCRFPFAVNLFASASATAPTAGKKAARPLRSMLSGQPTSLNTWVKRPNSTVNTSVLAVGRDCSLPMIERRKSSSESCQKPLPLSFRAMSSGSNAASRGYDRSREPSSTRRTESDWNQRRPVTWFARCAARHEAVASVASLLAEVRACTQCAMHLPLGPRPVLQMHPLARILIAAQAPGKRVHETGVPFNDASGERLRTWLGISSEAFYDPSQIAILPMGFCFPGAGKSGDLPPRPECAATWRQPLLSHLKNLRLTLVIGKYALAYHLPSTAGSVTASVQAWREQWPRVVPLPHPSPRNNLWLKRNPWFENALVPALQSRVAEVLAGAG